MISGTVADNNVSVYDQGRKAHFGGSGSGGQYTLYDHAYSHHVNLKIAANRFEGYDYGSACHFSGNISGRSAVLYDYGAQEHFNYAI